MESVDKADALVVESLAVERVGAMEDDDSAPQA